MEVNNCQSLEEVRNHIDQLDDQIVELIAARNGYVKQAANFKHSIEEIKANERMEAVMDRVRNQCNGIRRFTESFNQALLYYDRCDG